MQIEIIIAAASVSVSILASAAIAAWQIREGAKALVEVASAIHADIKASQEKLERKIQQKKR